MTPRVHHIHSRATETPDAIERKSCLCWGKCGDVCGIAISSRRHVPRRHSPVPLDHVQEARRSEAHFRRFYSWVTNHFPCSQTLSSDPLPSEPRSSLLALHLSMCHTYGGLQLLGLPRFRDPCPNRVPQNHAATRFIHGPSPSTSVRERRGGRCRVGAETPGSK